MSDSDDTDFLLLIPPDFFLVQTTDFDEIESEEDRFQLVEQSVVNNLITHVNELENRISFIENLDGSQLPSLDCSNLDGNEIYLEPNPHHLKYCSKQINDNFSHNSMSNFVNKLGGSIDSVTQNHYLKHRNDFVSPPRLRQPFSLPSTPTHGDYNKTEFPISRLNDKDKDPILGIDLGNNNGRKGIVSKGSENLTTEIKNKPPHSGTVYPLSDTIHSDKLGTIPDNKVFSEGKELLGEIDQYLSDIDKRGGIFQNKDEKSHNSSSLRALHHSRQDISNESGFNIEDGYYENLTNAKNHNEIHLDLPEVDRLLKEMETTQNKIEQKLKSHISLNKSVDIVRGNSDSIPDSSFGLKEIDRSPTKNIGDSDEKCYPYVSKVTESFVKRKVLPSGENENKAENNIDYITDKNSLLQNSCFPSSRKKLDMENRNTEVNKQLLLPDYISHDQNIETIYKPISDLTMTENTSLKSIDVYKNKRPIINKHFSPTKYNISKHVNLESFRDKFNSERDRQVHLTNSKDALKHHTTLQSGLNTENIHSTTSSKTNDKLYKGSSDRHQATAITAIYSSDQKQSSSNLLSLTDLWNKEPVFLSDDPYKLRQKLEEEKYRRQHCEEMIQSLQYRVLEDQEKLAVAIHVDQEKDKAILQLTDAWKKLAKHWGELEEQRHALAQQLQTEKDSNKIKIEEMKKKVNRWETEVAQALDLAAGYKQKYEDMAKEKEALKTDFTARIESAEKQVDSMSRQNQQYISERTEIKQQIEQYKKKAEEDKQTIREVQAELAEAKNQLFHYDAEINILKEQKQALSEKLKDEKAHNNTLDQQKLQLQQGLDEAKKMEKTAKDEARMYGERIEVARTELRALYQGQLEAVVREKLREFQNQLDAAEAALKAELQARETLWAEKANNQCKLLNEKHKTELQQIQCQHREELKTWRMKVIDCERIKSAVESQLQEEANKRTDIAQRLHSVMETQWRQALKIITNPNSINTIPISNVGPETKNLQLQGGDKSSNVHLELKDMCNEASSVASVALSNGEGKNTYRIADSQPHQDQLKKYIQMLLDRAPGNPVDGSTLWSEPVPDNPPLSPGSSFGGRWSAFLPLQDDKHTNTLENKLTNAGQSLNKPPWK